MDNKSKGMLTLKQLKDMVEAGEIHTVVTVFSDLYGRPMGKRIDADYFLDHAAQKGMHACNYLFTVDMAMEPVPGYTYSNWETGYGDFHCIPDFQTLRVAAWMDRSAIVVCDVYEERSDELTAVAPRSILKKQNNCSKVCAIGVDCESPTPYSNMSYQTLLVLTGIHPTLFRADPGRPKPSMALFFPTSVTICATIGFMPQWGSWFCLAHLHRPGKPFPLLDQETLGFVRQDGQDYYFIRFLPQGDEYGCRGGFRGFTVAGADGARQI